MNPNYLSIDELEIECTIRNISGALLEQIALLEGSFLLLSILADIGFRGKSNTWFASYLNDRTARVKINDTLSPPKTVSIGVPQGSVLGPVLFLIYTNSIFKLNLYGNCTGFADDMALAYTTTSLKDLPYMLNTDLKLLYTWFNKHRLVLSDKTKYMVFKTSGSINVSDLSPIKYHNLFECSDLSCHPDCLNIELVNSFKYLGVHLDTNLNWKEHVRNVKLYMSAASRIFYLLRNFCPVPVLKITYHALVMAKLQYGLSCWGSCNLTMINTLFTQQKTILRTILRKRRTVASWPLFKSNSLLPLQHLYVYKVLRIFFKRSGQYTFRTDTRYNIRSHLHFRYTIPRYYSDHFRRWIVVAAPTFFNALPEAIRRQVSSRSFFSEVKNWLMDMADITFLFRVVA